MLSDNLAAAREGKVHFIDTMKSVHYFKSCADFQKTKNWDGLNIPTTSDVPSCKRDCGRCL